MSWMDLMALFFIGVFTTLGYKRGIVLEITDFVAITLGGFMGFRLFEPISNVLFTRFFSGWNHNFLDRLLFFGLFTTTFLLVFSFGFHFQRKLKEDKKLEKEMDQKLGALIGAFKAVWLVTLCVGLFFYVDAVSPRHRKKLKRGMVIRMLSGLKLPISPFVYFMAPSKYAKDYLAYGLGNAKEKKVQARDRNKEKLDDESQDKKKKSKTKIKIKKSKKKAK